MGCSARRAARGTPWPSDERWLAEATRAIRPIRKPYGAKQAPTRLHKWFHDAYPEGDDTDLFMVRFRGNIKALPAVLAANRESGQTHRLRGSIMLTRLEERFVRNAGKKSGGTEAVPHLRLLENMLFNHQVGVDRPAEYSAVRDAFCRGEPSAESALFRVLRPKLERFHALELAKARKLLLTLRGHGLTISFNGSEAQVPSESGGGKSYAVNLANGTCTCQSGSIAAWMGLWCKHGCAAWLTRQ